MSALADRLRATADDLAREAAELRRLADEAEAGARQALRPAPGESRYLTVAEAATEAAVSVELIYRLTHSGTLPSRKFAGALRIAREDWERYLAERPGPGHTNGAAAPTTTRPPRRRKDI